MHACAHKYTLTKAAIKQLTQVFTCVRPLSEKQQMKLQQRLATNKCTYLLQVSFVSLDSCVIIQSIG
jgi:hypothetical protein